MPEPKITIAKSQEAPRVYIKVENTLTQIARQLATYSFDFYTAGSPNEIQQKTRHLLDAWLTRDEYNYQITWIGFD